MDEPQDFEALVAEVLGNKDARTASKENAMRRQLASSFEEAMERHGLSLRQLAKEMRSSPSQVQRLLHREVGGSLTLRTVCRAADALNLRVSIHVRDVRVRAGNVCPFGKVDNWSPAELPVPASVACLSKRKVTSPRAAKKDWRAVSEGQEQLNERSAS